MKRARSHNPTLDRDGSGTGQLYIVRRDQVKMHPRIFSRPAPPRRGSQILCVEEVGRLRPRPACDAAFEDGRKSVFLLRSHFREPVQRRPKPGFINNATPFFGMTVGACKCRFKQRFATGRRASTGCLEISPWRSGIVRARLSSVRLPQVRVEVGTIEGPCLRNHSMAAQAQLST